MNEKRLSGETITSDYGELTIFLFFSSQIISMVLFYRVLSSELGTAIEFDRRMSVTSSDDKLIHTILDNSDALSPIHITSDTLCLSPSD